MSVPSSWEALVVATTAVVFSQTLTVASDMLPALVKQLQFFVPLTVLGVQLNLSFTMKE